MPNAIEKLKIALQSGSADPSMLEELQKEYAQLHKRADALEELLIMVVRTGWPWDDDGEPNAIFHSSKGGFAAAMTEARELLGLDHLSMINRTEPRT
jgi:hypothetical protein